MPGAAIHTVDLIRLRESAAPSNVVSYVEVRDDSGVGGYGGPLYPGQASALREIGRASCRERV